MLSWEKFVENQISEIFDTEQSKPINGEWFDNQKYAEFHFTTSRHNIKYVIFFSKHGSGGVSIDFEPEDSENYTELNTFEHQEIGNALIYATFKYIRDHNPTYLTWYPVEKTTTQNNKNARAKIYSRWMKKHLYPQYIPADTQNPSTPTMWIRNDVYKQFSQASN